MLEQRKSMNNKQRQATSMNPVRLPRGMTIVEIIAVVGIIVVLLAILLPALSVASGNARWATSQSNMKQIYQLMLEYTTDNRETIVPAAFDYSENSYPGNVRSAQPPGAVPPLQSENGMRLNYGTWSDILWTYGKFGVPTGVSGGTLDAAWSYLYDSPDRVYFEKTPGYDTIFRSNMRMEKAAGGTDALPFGNGSQMSESGDNGYFAANLLFDARPDSSENLHGDWRTSAEVRRPGKTVYLVDSYYGEVIAPTPEGFGSPEDPSGTTFDGQIDFRYPGETCLMLFMDGHVGTEGKWDLFDDLNDLRGIQVDSLR
jgi:type II secretory pathway pseudopilin PulG